MGGGGVAEGVGLQTLDGTGRANSFLQLIQWTGDRTRPRATPRTRPEQQCGESTHAIIVLVVEQPIRCGE